MGNITSVFDVKTVTITWDSLHILYTLAIYVTLIIFIGSQGLIHVGTKYYVTM